MKALAASLSRALNRLHVSTASGDLFAAEPGVDVGALRSGPRHFVKNECSHQVEVVGKF